MHARFARKINTRQIDRTVNRVLKNLIAVLPAVPYLTRRRRTPVAAYTLGSIGLALSGIAALMYLSPGTRSRALGAAKGTYGKVNERIIHRREKRIEGAPPSNGERVEPPITAM